MKKWKKLMRNLHSDSKKLRREARADLIGLCCALFLVVVAIAGIIVANIPALAGVKDSEVPETALTLVGTAPGRNDDITVTVVADNEKIYQIKVDEHKETDGIGSEAVKQLPAKIFQAQSLKVDAISGATISSNGIKNAIIKALDEGGIKPVTFGGSVVKVETVAEKVQTHSGVTVTLAKDWSEEYPYIYASWDSTKENSEVTDYLVDYPMLKTLYEPYGFSKDYKAARGHAYTLEDVVETKRTGENSKASCWTCKTPQFTNMVNEQGIEVYGGSFMELVNVLTEPISCYTCHANTPGVVTVTHTYLIDGVGEDFESIDAADLACGQCHNEYFFDPGNGGATTLPHTSLASMSPDDILAFYNDGSNFPDGEPFADYTNPRTGVRQIKVQHPEIETFLGEGSQHRGDYTCADCHMAMTEAEDGTVYKDHSLISPLDNPALIESECSKCHEDLVAEVRAEQERIEARTYSIGYELEFLTERLAKAVEDNELSDADLAAVRSLARDAQFYWDFVFVENAEGVHNPKLTDYCLDMAEKLCNQALGMFQR
ncbi:MAG: ammonia-forming cytochrome c nitrite reductase subunit c552 [Oscillospiraceae bacterium]|nr:ammonia-forming cytochrome c nitrite reductase subunit c552 [Oscillospiraceae bacterium]